jgi:energy-coupling factor transporter transmembrane protein EcfT
MNDKKSRREIMKPIQLLGLAFGAALFAGIVTLVSMGFFQAHPVEEIQRAVVAALVVAGITFIVVLVGISLLMLAIDPSEISRPVERPVLLDPPRTGEDGGDAPAATDGDGPATR